MDVDRAVSSHAVADVLIAAGLKTVVGFVRGCDAQTRYGREVPFDDLSAFRYSAQGALKLAAKRTYCVNTDDARSAVLRAACDEVCSQIVLSGLHDGEGFGFNAQDALAFVAHWNDNLARGSVSELLRIVASRVIEAARPRYVPPERTPEEQAAYDQAQGFWDEQGLDEPTGIDPLMWETSGAGEATDLAVEWFTRSRKTAVLKGRL